MATSIFVGQSYLHCNLWRLDQGGFARSTPSRWTIVMTIYHSIQLRSIQRHTSSGAATFHLEKSCTKSDETSGLRQREKKGFHGKHTHTQDQKRNPRYMYRLKKWSINDILSCDIDIYTVYYSINYIIIYTVFSVFCHIPFCTPSPPFFPKQVQLSWHLKPIGSLMNFPSVAPRAGMDTKPHGFNGGVNVHNGI